MAYKAEIVIPTEPDHADDVIDQLSTAMATTFGGYSRYDGEGGWFVPEDGTVIEEPHTRIVVTDVDNTMDWDELTDYIERKAESARLVLDQDAVFWYVTEVEAGLA